MTECERIVNEGILPESYFQEEVKCDFLVEPLRKRIWAIELDLLLEFDRVCKKNHLRYFLTGGTLLGAIRHNGFIPWDDDIDILVPRDDFEKLLLLKDEFHYPYFFQTPVTDPGYYFAFPRLRNSRTSAIQRPFCDCGYNMGIFIDILPLDFITYDDAGRKMFDQLTKLLIDSSTSMKAACKYLNKRDEERVNNLPAQDPIERYHEIHRLATSMKDSGSSFCFPSTGVVYGFERTVYRWSDCSDTIDGIFESYHLPIPIGYDNVLKTIFGEYTKLPPLEERGGWHGSIWFDTERSYLEVKQNPRYQEWACSIY